MPRVIMLVLLLAAVVYAVFWVIDRRSQRGTGGTPSKRLPPGPRGPDDDDAFLRDLDWRRRRDASRRPADPPTQDRSSDPSGPPDGSEQPPT